MDPDVTLATAIECAQACLADEDPHYPDNLGQDAVALAEAFLALHEWIRNGGFLPAIWKGTQK